MLKRGKQFILGIEFLSIIARHMLNWILNIYNKIVAVKLGKKKLQYNDNFWKLRDPHPLKEKRRIIVFWNDWLQEIEVRLK